MMKPGNAHPQFARDTLDLKRRVDMFAQLFEGPGNAARVTAGSEQMAKPRALLAT